MECNAFMGLFQVHREREEMKKVKQNMQSVFAQKDFANMLRRILIDGFAGFVREGSVNALSH